ncbi:hypothetical protein TL16_g03099 [Triparma laevis f. inornata]|uniref:Uncharacterized protein n=1 Tax=Triparma laevis f. inornata TaxID=1714386 RepID=A0A9W7A0G5_9STRA|nr:hypothetical protein TL16_g03099 [Triparma laevis f. inornata]
MAELVNDLEQASQWAQAHLIKDDDTSNSSDVDPDELDLDDDDEVEKQTKSIPDPDPIVDSDSNSDSDSDSDLDLQKEVAKLEKMTSVDETDSAPTSAPSTKNEIKDPLPPPLPQKTQSLVSATAQSDLLLIGTLKSHIIPDRILIISSLSAALSGNSNCDEGSLLVFKDNENNVRPLGEVSEVFGPVDGPLYTVALPVYYGEASPEEGNEDKQDWWSTSTSPGSVLLKKSMSIYAVRSEISELSTSKILKQSGRGCDASDMNDEETAPDYSDDEEEMRIKREKKKGKAGGGEGGEEKGC